MSKYESSDLQKIAVQLRDLADRFDLVANRANLIDLDGANAMLKVGLSYLSKAVTRAEKEAGS